MSSDICFTLINRLTQNTGQSVLVYMLPVVDRVATDLFLSAWQVLNPSANGGSQRFSYRGRLQLAVEYEPTCCRSALVDVRPNQLYHVTNSDNQGPTLTLSYAESPPSAKQVAVRNDTDPPLDLSVLWYMDGQPIAVQRGLNLGARTTLQLSLAFYFMVATPKFKGMLDQFSEEFIYLAPADDVFQSVAMQRAYRLTPGVRQVEVNWLRPGGLSSADVLLFNPPSSTALPVPLT
ncbi:MAG: hypothetical protein ABUT39_25235 [Acidobacteriota bacterium]